MRDSKAKKNKQKLGNKEKMRKKKHSGHLFAQTL